MFPHPSYYEKAKNATEIIEAKNGIGSCSLSTEVVLFQNAVKRVEEARAVVDKRCDDLVGSVVAAVKVVLGDELMQPETLLDLISDHYDQKGLSFAYSVDFLHDPADCRGVKRKSPYGNGPCRRVGEDAAAGLKRKVCQTCNTKLYACLLCCRTDCSNVVEVLEMKCVN